MINNYSQKLDSGFINDMAGIYASFSRREQQNFSKRLMYLYNQFLWGVGLPQPYYVILDHSVLVSIRDANKESEMAAYHAVRTFFHFLQHFTDYDLRVAVSPANLYEWNKTKPLENEAQYSSTLREINHYVTSLGLPAFLFRCGNYREAQKNLKGIVADVRKISPALTLLKAEKWDINFREGKRTYFLPHITDRLVPKMRLKYFSHHYVQTVLRSVIDSQVISHSSDTYVRTRLRIEGINWMASLLKISKGKFEGVGDLEMLEQCATGRQFRDKNGPALIGLTFDKTLFKVLRYYAHYSIDSQPIVVGVDSEELIKRKLKEHLMRVRDDQRADARKESFSRRFFDFTTELERVISERLTITQTRAEQ